MKIMKKIIPTIMLTSGLLSSFLFTVNAGEEKFCAPLFTSSGQFIKDATRVQDALNMIWTYAQEDTYPWNQWEENHLALRRLSTVQRSAREYWEKLIPFVQAFGYFSGTVVAEAKSSPEFKNLSEQLQKIRQREPEQQIAEMAWDQKGSQTQPLDELKKQYEIIQLFLAIYGSDMESFCPYCDFKLEL